MKTTFKPTTLAASLTTAVLLAGAVHAGVTVTVTVTGTVEFNQIGQSPLGDANVDDVATMTFLVDSDVFIDSATFPTRGYEIDQDSFSLTIGGTAIGLQDPFPAGDTPYFVLRNDDPAVDGFFVSTLVDFPIGVPLDQPGIFEFFRDNFSVTYLGDTLTSLDILDAAGTYDFAGLTVFNFTIDDGPFNAMGLVFTDLTIECGLPPVPYCEGKLNSQGCTPFMSTDAGVASLTGGPWNVTTQDLINNKACVMFYGLAGDDTPLFGGTRCILPPLMRTPLQSSGGNPGIDDCSGSISVDVTSALDPAFVPGTIFLQTLSRDPAASFDASLSNAVEVTVCP